MIKKSSLVAIARQLAAGCCRPAAGRCCAGRERRHPTPSSHGSPADPVWNYFLDGANQWAADTGHQVNTSFFREQLKRLPDQEAIRSAIAANADGIVTTVPELRTLIEVVDEARAAGIPIININTYINPARIFDSYVGTINEENGRQWAQYLVDGDYVSEGDFVWMPVEVPGALDGVDEERGIASVFEPLGIEWEVTDATYEQATVIDEMVNYLTANRDKVDAMIGLGDLVTGSVARVWDQVGVAPGEIPVVAGQFPSTAHREDHRRVRPCRQSGSYPRADQLSRADPGVSGHLRGLPAGLRHPRRLPVRGRHGPGRSDPRR